MIYSVFIQSDVRLVVRDFLRELDVPFRFELDGDDGECNYYYFTRPDSSFTYFLIIWNRKGEYELMMDGLASFSDYKFFPYLADCLRLYLKGKLLTASREEVADVYRQYDESWIETSIGEEIATLKSNLSVFPRYYLSLYQTPFSYVSVDLLAQYAVNLHSSTGRIYGYIQYMLKNNLLPSATQAELEEDRERDSWVMEVDVPQHQSIGEVKSWQIDGSEVWESYSLEDTEMLLKLGERYLAGEKITGVVLNDLGTIYQEGIGVPQDGLKAEYWFRQAYVCGDHLYAPTNLGDLYRKGCGELPVSLPKAFEAYRKSEDIYALYRIGQAYEEGWTGPSDMKEALRWYKKAAAKKHHLAVKRLEELSKTACTTPRKAK